MRLSVIIPSLNGIKYLSKCIEGLRHQTLPPEEVIIIDSTVDHIAKQIPDFEGLKVCFLVEPVGVPEMRSIGFRMAEGDLVAMTEDHCIPTPNWCENIRRLHEKYSEEVIGGAVENGATESLIDWSCYLCEYLDFMLPLIDAPKGTVPGNNVAYKRSVINSHKELFTAGLWEYFVHAELAKAGIIFRMDSSLVVLHRKYFTVNDFQTQCYYFARSFGAMRVSQATSSQLWFYRFVSVSLPILVIGRLFQKVFLRKRARYKEFLLSIHYTIWFQLCWCCGEMTGYWFGEGDSTKKVE